LCLHHKDGGQVGQTFDPSTPLGYARGVTQGRTLSLSNGSDTGRSEARLSLKTTNEFAEAGIVNSKWIPLSPKKPHSPLFTLPSFVPSGRFPSHLRRDEARPNPSDWDGELQVWCPRPDSNWGPAV
jgi:hypothetical protein